MRLIFIKTIRMASDMTIPAPAPGQSKSKKRKIPAYLVKETIGGVPFYYAGFRSVLVKRKSLEDLMADVVEGVAFNIAALLAEKGIRP